MFGQGRAALPTIALMEPAAEGRSPARVTRRKLSHERFACAVRRQGRARVLAGVKCAPDAGVQEPPTVRGHLHEHCTTGVWTAGAREYGATIADIEASRRGHHQLRAGRAELQQRTLDGIFPRTVSSLGITTD